MRNLFPARWSDFYAPYIGTRAGLHRHNPYGDDVTSAIQVWFYGHVLDPGNPEDRLDKEAFVYPGYAVILFAPLAILPWPVIWTIFKLALMPLLALCSWLWIRMCGLAPNPVRTAAILTLILSSWPAVWICQITQPAVLVFTALTISCLLLRHRYDLPAGVILVLATVKPQFALMLVLWLLVWAVFQRRWSFLIAFSGCFTALLLFTFTLLPGWVPEWLRAVDLYRRAPKPTLFASLFGGYNLLAVALFSVWVLYAIRKSRHAAADSMEFVRAAALLLAFTLCLIPGGPWLTYNQIALIPGVILLCTFRPQRLLARFARGIALFLTSVTVLITPICATLSLLRGYSRVLAVLPLENVLLPLAVTIALGFSMNQPAEPVQRRRPAADRTSSLAPAAQ